MPSNYENPPAWFNLKNYDATRNMSALDWQKNIAVREGLGQLLEQELTLRSSATVLDYGEAECQDSQSLFDAEFSKLLAEPIQHAKETPLITTNSAVFPLTIERAQLLVNVIAYQRECHSVSNNSAKSSCDDELAVYGEEGFAMHQHLVIDFRASKQEIQQDFNAWLNDTVKKHRAIYPRKKEPGITDKTLSDWHRDRVLPYQDLFLWHKRHCKTMPRGSALMDWLKPLGDSSRDKAYALEDAAKQIFSLRTIKQLSFPIGHQLNDCQQG